MTELTAIPRAAAALIQARERGIALSALEGDMAPATLADAYAIQDATMDRIGPAGGWKVAARPDGEPRCAVLPAKDIHRSGAQFPVSPVGYEIEVEMAFVLRRGLREGGDVLDAIGSVHLAIEVLGSRFVDRKALPPLQPIADLQSNAAVVLGPEVAGWRSRDLLDLDFTLQVDGAPLAGPQNHHSADTAISALAWLADHAAARGRPLEPGTVVITGARLGPLKLGPGRRVVASCPGWGEVTAEFSVEKDRGASPMFGFRIRNRGNVASAKLVETFRRLPVANVSDVMSRMTAGGARLRPMHDGTVMSGIAITVKTRPGDNLMIHRAMDMAGPGDVIVVDGGGDLTNSLMGEIMAAYATRRGIAGFVLDGAIRDAGALRTGSLPIFAAGVTHRGPYKDGPGEINGSIAVDGMVVNPGDIIIGDEDGVLCIPIDAAEEIAAAATTKLAEEEKQKLAIAEGRVNRDWIQSRLKSAGCIFPETESAA